MRIPCLLLGLLSACAPRLLSSPVRAPLHSLAGWWVSAKPALPYIGLIFSDSTATFASRADTVYRFRFVLRNDGTALVLTDEFGKQVTATILKLDQDSLVVSRLWDVDSVKRYTRFYYKP